MPRDNERVEAILYLRVIEEQLQQLTYAVHELMEENQLVGDEQKEVSRSWVEEIRTAVSPLANSQPREILETSSLGVVKKSILYFLSIHTASSL